MNGYSRVYIPLKQDSAAWTDGGYSINGKPLVGKCIIETTNNKKVKITASVSNLIPKTHYKLYLISGKDGASYCAGNINVDTGGRGDVKLELDSDFDKTITARQIDAVSVIVQKKPDGTDFTPILTGYRDFEFMWKNNFRPADTIKPAPKPEVHSHEMNKTEIYKSEIYKSEIHKSEIHKPEALKPEPFRTETNKYETAKYEPAKSEPNNPEKAVPIFNFDSAQKPADAIPKLNPAIHVSPEEQKIHDTMTEMASVVKEKLNFTQDGGQTDTAFEAEINAQAAATAEETVQTTIEDIFKNNQKVFPYFKLRKKVEWVKIGIAELSILPADLSHFVSEPVIMRTFQMFNHFIFGRANGRNGPEYYLGVPVKYDKALTSEFARVGFTQFKLCEEDIQRQEIVGYYLTKF
ncbi:MAG: hypothetical protein LBS21_15260 [Clostridiales bacterium]|jgi:hypothetical protein|nr:hypothetical protein [Clostridiales bacterium]